MITKGGLDRDLAALVVPPLGPLVATGDRYEPYQLIDPGGAVVDPVTAYFRDLLAAGRSELTVRSYGFDLVRWFRFCWAAGVGWDRATRIPGPGLLPVAAGHRQAVPAALACARTGPGCGRCPGGRGVCAVGAGAYRDGAARFLRLLPAGGQRAGHQPVPAGPPRPGRDGHTRTTIRWSLTAMSAVAFTGRGLLPGSRAASRTASSTRSSRRCRRTGTGRWWRSMCRPGRGHQSCCRRPWAALSRGGS